jgi:hypothetical protein
MTAGHHVGAAAPALPPRSYTMKRNTLSALMALALVAAPFAVSAASPLSYTYVEANYLDLEIDAGDGIDVSGNGGGINGSIAFGDSSFYGLAGYDTVGEEFDGIDVDVNRVTAGVGYVLKIDERFHALGEIAYVDYELDVSDLGSGSADGYRASVGLRGLMADNIEGVAKVGYTRVDESGVRILDGAVGEIGFRWHIDAAWSAGLSTEFGEDITSYKLGLRLQW